jgi:hypothetical protein
VGASAQSLPVEKSRVIIIDPPPSSPHNHPMPAPRPYRVPRPPERNLPGEIIGRCALAVIGLGLLFGGYKCIRTGIDIERDFNQRHATDRYYTRSGSGAGAPLGIGIVLLIVGAPFLTAAVVPLSVIEKLLGRQTNNTLWQNPDPSTNVRNPNSFL